VKTGAPSELPFKLGWNFFGYSAKDRAELHSRLYDILEAGQGKWDWNTLYHLPIPVRRMWVYKLNKRAEERLEEAEATKNSNKKV
jgi:hypothetical protein